MSPIAQVRRFAECGHVFKDFPSGTVHFWMEVADTKLFVDGRNPSCPSWIEHFDDDRYHVWIAAFR